eukprot:jgi/Bigna1/75101/fgenesh1_pg.32_\
MNGWGERCLSQVKNFEIFNWKIVGNPIGNQEKVERKKQTHPLTAKHLQFSDPPRPKNQGGAQAKEPVPVVNCFWRTRERQCGQHALGNFARSTFVQGALSFPGESARRSEGYSRGKGGTLSPGFFTPNITASSDYVPVVYGKIGCVFPSIERKFHRSFQPFQVGLRRCRKRCFSLHHQNRNTSSLAPDPSNMRASRSKSDAEVLLSSNLPSSSPFLLCSEGRSITGSTTMGLEGPEIPPPHPPIIAAKIGKPGGSNHGETTEGKGKNLSTPAETKYSNKNGKGGTKSDRFCYHNNGDYDGKCQANDHCRIGRGSKDQHEPMHSKPCYQKEKTKRRQKTQKRQTDVSAGACPSSSEQRYDDDDADSIRIIQKEMLECRLAHSAHRLSIAPVRERIMALRAALRKVTGCCHQGHITPRRKLLWQLLEPTQAIAAPKAVLLGGDVTATNLCQWSSVMHKQALMHSLESKDVDETTSQNAAGAAKYCCGFDGKCLLSLRCVSFNRGDSALQAFLSPTLFEEDSYAQLLRSLRGFPEVIGAALGSGPPRKSDPANLARVIIAEICGYSSPVERGGDLSSSDGESAALALISAFPAPLPRIFTLDEDDVESEEGHLTEFSASPYHRNPLLEVAVSERGKLRGNIRDPRVLPTMRKQMATGHVGPSRPDDCSIPRGLLKLANLANRAAKSSFGGPSGCNVEEEKDSASSTRNGSGRSASEGRRALQQEEKPIPILLVHSSRLRRQKSNVAPPRKKTIITELPAPWGFVFGELVPYALVHAESLGVSGHLPVNLAARRELRTIASLISALAGRGGEADDSRQQLSINNGPSHTSIPSNAIQRRGSDGCAVQGAFGVGKASDSGKACASSTHKHYRGRRAMSSYEVTAQHRRRQLENSNNNDSNNNSMGKNKRRARQHEGSLYAFLPPMRLSLRHYLKTAIGLGRDKRTVSSGSSSSTSSSSRGSATRPLINSDGAGPTTDNAASFCSIMTAEMRDLKDFPTTPIMISKRDARTLHRLLYHHYHRGFGYGTGPRFSKSLPKVVSAALEALGDPDDKGGACSRPHSFPSQNPYGMVASFDQENESTSHVIGENDDSDDGAEDGDGGGVARKIRPPLFALLPEVEGFTLPQVNLKEKLLAATADPGQDESSDKKEGGGEEEIIHPPPSSQSSLPLPSRHELAKAVETLIKVASGLPPISFGCSLQEMYRKLEVGGRLGESLALQGALKAVSNALKEDLVDDGEGPPSLPVTIEKAMTTTQKKKKKEKKRRTSAGRQRGGGRMLPRWLIKRISMIYSEWRHTVYCGIRALAEFDFRISQDMERARLREQQAVEALHFISSPTGISTGSSSSSRTKEFIKAVSEALASAPPSCFDEEAGREEHGHENGSDSGDGDHAAGEENDGGGAVGECSETVKTAASFSSSAAASIASEEEETSPSRGTTIAAGERGEKGGEDDETKTFRFDGVDTTRGSRTRVKRRSSQANNTDIRTRRCEVEAESGTAVASSSPPSMECELIIDAFMCRSCSKKLKTIQDIVAQYTNDNIPAETSAFYDSNEDGGRDAKAVSGLNLRKNVRITLKKKKKKKKRIFLLSSSLCRHDLFRGGRVDKQVVHLRDFFIGLASHEALFRGCPSRNQQFSEMLSKLLHEDHDAKGSSSNQRAASVSCESHAWTYGSASVSMPLSSTTPLLEMTFPPTGIRKRLLLLITGGLEEDNHGLIRALGAEISRLCESPSIITKMKCTYTSTQLYIELQIKTPTINDAQKSIANADKILQSALRTGVLGSSINESWYPVVLAIAIKSVGFTNLISTVAGLAAFYPDALNMPGYARTYGSRSIIGFTLKRLIRF